MGERAVSADPFDLPFATTVGEEGSTLDLTRSDRGNWTGGKVGLGVLRGSKFGISAAAYPTLNIAGLTLADARAIYARDYFAPVRGPELPPALAVLAFDAAVNCGASTARRLLQLAVGVTADGVLGPRTMAAVSGCDLRAACVEFQAQRTFYQADNPGEWADSGLGWSRRFLAVLFVALAAI
jgi:lysozyme family protein